MRVSDDFSATPDNGGVLEDFNDIDVDISLDLEGGLDLDFDSSSSNLNLGSDDMFSDSINISDFEEIALGRPKTSKIVATVFMGMLVSFILCVLVYGLYMNHIKYPAQQEVVESSTGIYCLRNWEKKLQSLESLGTTSYIAQEVVYANGNQTKIDFYKKMLSTIKYTPKEVVAKNIYGNDMINREDDSVVKIPSYVSSGESVVLSYIDYEGIKFDKSKVKTLMKKHGLKLGDADYNNKLVEVFCEYMNDLNTEEIPIKKVDYVPNIQLNKSTPEVLGYYSVLEQEDIYIDTLLFSSKEFYDLLDRFSVVAGKVSKNKTIKPTKEWTKWSKLSDEKKAKKEEPVKYNVKQVVSRQWCGVYHLKNEVHETDTNGTESIGISAEVGDGTFSNPAGLNTSILTYKVVTKKGKTKKYPIRVKLIEFGVSEDAIDWFESKDERNRGIDISSESQYCYYVFEVTNLSSKTLTIKDNSAVCDDSSMLSPRTGTIYGLQDSIKLKQDETGIIESWNKSTELNKKYVIWGADFSRKENPVWFRVLSGNPEDTSEEKGVTINDSRTRVTPTPTPTPTPIATLTPAKGR